MAGGYCKVKKANISKSFEKEWDKVRLGAKTSFREKLDSGYKNFLKYKKEGVSLPPEYKDHGLNNDRRYVDYRDAHLSGDIVIIYQEDGDEIKLLHVGSHSNLFEEKELSK